jgi:hypothetical protein
VELRHSLTCPVPPEREWQVLLDAGGVVPGMPGITVGGRPPMTPGRG